MPDSTARDPSTHDALITAASESAALVRRALHNPGSVAHSPGDRPPGARHDQHQRDAEAWSAFASFLDHGPALLTQAEEDFRALHSDFDNPDFETIERRRSQLTRLREAVRVGQQIRDSFEFAREMILPDHPRGEDTLRRAEILRNTKARRHARIFAENVGVLTEIANSMRASQTDSTRHVAKATTVTHHGAHSPETLHTFEVAQDGTLHFTLLARDLAHAHARVADLESCENVADIPLGDGVRLTHVTHGSVQDTDITAAPVAQAAQDARFPTRLVGGEGRPGAYIYGDALLALTDQLNGSQTYPDAAALLHQIADPFNGLLERLGEFFEAAAQKAKEAEQSDGFDLSDDLADAAADVRKLVEVLDVAEDRLRALTAPPLTPRPSRTPLCTPRLPPPALPPTQPRHQR
ncbi:hypothetical protein [Streptomyces sp. NPDC005004]